MCKQIDEFKSTFYWTYNLVYCGQISICTFNKIHFFRKNKLWFCRPLQKSFESNDKSIFRSIENKSKSAIMSFKIFESLSNLKRINFFVCLWSINYWSESNYDGLHFNFQIIINHNCSSTQTKKMWLYDPEKYLMLINAS